MATNENTQIPSHDNCILARDLQEGSEHWLRISNHAGLVALEGIDGDQLTLVLNPHSAIELALALIMACDGRFRPVITGPLSSRF